MRQILAQSLANIEVIVVDDGSTDDTRTRLERCQDSRLRHLEQPHRGAAAARNLGARAATSPLLTFVDSDDEVSPAWLERLACWFEKPEIGVAFCGTRYLMDADKEHLQPPFRLGPLFNDWIGSFTAASFMMRTQVFHAIGGYDESLPANQHTELGFRLVDHCDRNGIVTAHTGEILVTYHRGDADGIRQNPAAVLEGTAALLSRYRTRLRRHPSTYVEYLEIAGTSAYRLGRSRVAWTYFATAIRAAPFRFKNYVRFLLALVPRL